MGALAHPSPDPALVMLGEVLADLDRAGIEPTPLTIISAATDRTNDDRLVLAVAEAAERRTRQVAA